MSITVHAEKSYVANIIGAASTEIVEQEFRAGKFKLTDGILAVDPESGRERVATLLDYSIERGPWKTSIFLIEQGCPIVPHLEEETVEDKGHAQFSTLGWAMLYEVAIGIGDGISVSVDIGRKLMRKHRRATEIDILKPCAINYDPYLDADEIMGGLLWLGRGDLQGIFHPRWPREKTTWNALEFAILLQKEELLDTMLRKQAIPSIVLARLAVLCKNDPNPWAYQLLGIHCGVASVRELRAIATAWACKSVPGNVWRDLTEILVPRMLAHTIRHDREDDGQREKRRKILD